MNSEEIKRLLEAQKDSVFPMLTAFLMVDVGLRECEKKEDLGCSQSAEGQMLSQNKNG